MRRFSTWLAVMIAAKIATSLGGAHPSGAWWRCRCPVHGSRGATLALRDGDRGLIVKCFGGCDRRDVLTELYRRRLISETVPRLPEFLRSTTRARAPIIDDGDRIASASHIWNCAREARKTPVAAYLAARGITMPVPPSLRWAPSLRRRDGSRGPAMVARIDSVDGEVIGISRTWLDRNPDGGWRRRDRAMLGRAAGGAIRLVSATDNLLIGEGIETCLAAITATAQPAWAALSTSGMMTLALPPTVRHIVILADNDRSGAGQRAAYAAAQRWRAEQRRVRIAMPPIAGTDFADVLLGAYEGMETAGDVG
jgi:putative DNA primase/helicase